MFIPENIELYESNIFLSTKTFLLKYRTKRREIQLRLDFLPALSQTDEICRGNFHAGGLLVYVLTTEVRNRTGTDPDSDQCKLVGRHAWSNKLKERCKSI